MCRVNPVSKHAVSNWLSTENRRKPGSSNPFSFQNTAQNSFPSALTHPRAGLCLLCQPNISVGLSSVLGACVQVGQRKVALGRRPFADCFSVVRLAQGEQRCVYHSGAEQSTREESGSIHSRTGCGPLPGEGPLEPGPVLGRSSLWRGGLS